MKINVKRVYDDASGVEADGFRVFVDRLWPRGESKEKFHYDLWARDVAPSTSLRQWFHADPDDRWPEFERRYMAELQQSDAASALARQLASHPVVTLLYSARDETRNNAVVLARYLRENA